MCGVAGIYAYHQLASPVDQEELRTIRDYMITRGPDGKGEWFSSNGRVGLGHRRLSIIDLSERASQPMVREGGSCIISFNGEIYNYKQLRQDLEVKGYQFSSESDTEVLLHLYEDQGEDMVHQLRGMFAFAIWDQDKKAIFLARDPYGIKPLYYADDGETVRFASQVKALLASNKVSRTPEPAGIVGFYLFGSVPEPWTCHEQIKALPAGSTLWVRSDGVAEPKEYFSISQVWTAAEQEAAGNEDVQDQIREALLDSVQHHMVSDVPVGAFLSAGVDSGALVGLMTDVMKEQGITNPIQTITLAFDEFKGRHDDEAPLAEQIAEQYGTQHTTRIVTQKEFEEDLPKILDAMDQPSIDGINTWFVAKAAKELGLKVAISGLGGDELLGGYGSFKDIPNWVRWMNVPSKVPFLGDLVRAIGEQLPNGGGMHPKAWGLPKYGGTYAGAWLLKRGLFMPWELKQVLDRELVEQGLERLQPLQHIAKVLKPSPEKSFGKVSSLESSLYMRNQLLRDSDWAGMAHSLEIRVPLVDSHLLKMCAPLLVKGNSLSEKKYLAYSPRNQLSEDVVKRPKTGFSTPIASWLQERTDINRWQEVRELKKQACPWAKRWAYSISTANFSSLT